MTLNSMYLLPLALCIAAVSDTSVSHDRNVTDNISSGQWKMVKNSEGVKTYFRWLTNTDGSSFRERKGEILVNCSAQEVLGLVSDAGSTKKWMSGISESFDLSRISQNEWYTYTLFSIPWPFSKRDLVSYYKVIPDPARGMTIVTINCKDKYVPLKPGITRLTNYRATWTITQRGDKNTFISFNMSSSAPPAFPRFIQDPVIESIFHNNLVRLKEVLQSNE